MFFCFITSITIREEQRMQCWTRTGSGPVNWEFLNERTNKVDKYKSTKMWIPYLAHPRIHTVTPVVMYLSNRCKSDPKKLGIAPMAAWLNLIGQFQLRVQIVQLPGSVSLPSLSVRQLKIILIVCRSPWNSNETVTYLNLRPKDNVTRDTSKTYETFRVSCDFISEW